MTSRHDIRWRNSWTTKGICDCFGQIYNGVDYPAFATKLMDTPNTAVANQVLFGKFSDLIIGTWAGIDMVTDPYSLGDTFQIRVVTHVLVGIGFRHGLSFCCSTDSGAQ